MHVDIYMHLLQLDNQHQCDVCRGVIDNIPSFSFLLELQGVIVQDVAAGQSTPMGRLLRGD